MFFARRSCSRFTFFNLHFSLFLLAAACSHRAEGGEPRGAVLFGAEAHVHLEVNGDGHDAGGFEVRHFRT
jgi:hypothetical protein